MKVGKILRHVGAKGLKQLGKTRKAWREEIHASLQAGRTYLLNPNLKFIPKT